MYVCVFVFAIIPTLLCNRGSAGVETLISYLNGKDSRVLLSKLTMSDSALKEEMQKANFWTGGNFVVEHCTCTGQGHTYTYIYTHTYIHTSRYVLKETRSSIR